ncbi:hypothetical protein KUCAC02_014151 [Chaenocephalus aceratus]|uniref:Uncharacterized protein n=1 Tax=Chaenocephalus aceratus TaxID=36190 RepID=A0ACB9WD06_CHAAC|nr:hypothetical protein KUCAC02_014151 [Chaenocephalus aceratus]
MSEVSVITARQENVLLLKLQRRLERADVRLHCELPSGSEAGGHRHKGPNGVTKDVQEAPLRLGEPQRGSPLSASLHGHSQTRARVEAAKPCVAGWDAWCVSDFQEIQIVYGACSSDTYLVHFHQWAIGSIPIGLPYLATCIDIRDLLK